jgi:hypothetical protein
LVTADEVDQADRRIFQLNANNGELLDDLTHPVAVDLRGVHADLHDRPVAGHVKVRVGQPLGKPVATLRQHRPSEDGGWWALGLSDPRHGARLSEVPMSEPTTGTSTRRTLERAGLGVVRGPLLRDVDTAEDAEAVARRCAPDSEFARAWERLR